MTAATIGGMDENIWIFVDNIVIIFVFWSIDIGIGGKNISSGIYIKYPANVEDIIDISIITKYR